MGHANIFVWFTRRLVCRYETRRGTRLFNFYVPWLGVSDVRSEFKGVLGDAYNMITCQFRKSILDQSL